MVIGEIDWDSTPGIPLRRLGSVNAEIFGWNGATVDDVKTRYVYELVKRRFAQLEEGPALDPILLFIKPEPHKAKKRDLKAWRLIHSISLVDNLVARILLGGFCAHLIDNYSQVPNKAGWTPSGGGYRWMLEELGQRNRQHGMRQPFVMADKSQWDFTMQGWVVEAFVGLLDRLTFDVGDGGWWRTVVLHHFAGLFHGCQLVIGNHFLQQTTYGIMKSGWYGTITFNSIAQVALHVLAAVRSGEQWKRSVPFALGDDTVQPHLKDIVSYTNELQQTGCVVKQMERSIVIEFGGHKFHQGGCVPSYGSKHAWLLARAQPEFLADTLVSYQMLYTYSPEWLVIVRKLMRSIGRVDLIRSDTYLEVWYNGYEAWQHVRMKTRIDAEEKKVWKGRERGFCDARKSLHAGFVASEARTPSASTNFAAVVGC